MLSIITIGIEACEGSTKQGAQMAPRPCRSLKKCEFVIMTELCRVQIGYTLGSELTVVKPLIRAASRARMKGVLVELKRLAQAAQAVDFEVHGVSIKNTKEFLAVA